jgi:hypothetical protein
MFFPEEKTFQRPVTFAEPDEGKGFVRRALDAAADVAKEAAGSGNPMIATAGLAYDKITRPVLNELGGLASELTDPDRRTGRRIAAAAWDQQTYVETTLARQASTEASFDRLIEAVQRSSGITMQNPLRGGYRDQAMLEMQADLGPGWRREFERTPAQLMNYGVSVFQRQLQDYADSDPKLADAIATARIDFSPQMIAARADADLQRETNDSRSVILSLGASLVGGAVPAMRDPINAAGLFLGGGASVAKGVAGRVLDVALREAAINAGLTAAQQPFVQDWRREAGLSAGFEEAASNVAMAAALGGVLGGGLQGVRELLPKAAAGDASVKDIRAALKSAGVKLDAEGEGILRVAETVERDEAMLIKGAPKGLPADDAAEALRAAVRHAEDPVNEPPPPIPVTVAEIRPDRARVTDESLPVTVGDVDTVDGKPVAFERFNPDEIGTDATAMQYKGGGDAAGVTDRLRSVTRWDPLAGGRVFVFERIDGTRIIADGHQRLGLARRLKAEGDSGRVELVGHLFREADGWTTTDVRALAAKKNMQEGSGTALDAARILRDRPDLADGALPTGGAVVRDGLMLARLSDEAFGMVINGVVPDAYGARVGALVANPLDHAGIMADLARFEPRNIREADLFIGESLRAGMVTETQVDMFGALESRVSLMAERVRVLSDAVRLLAGDKKLFGVLERDAGRIEAAGNQLTRDTNAQLAQQAAELQAIVEKLARRHGPVSDALTEAARTVKDGGKIGPAAKAFVGELRTIIERDGLPALLADPQLRPTAAVEPGTPAALAAADRIEPRDDLTFDMFMTEKTAAGDQTLIPGVKPVTDQDRMAVEAAKPLQGGDTAPPAGGLFDDGARQQIDLMDALPLPGRDDPTGTRLASRQEALAEADQLGFAADLVKACKT